MTFFCSGLSRPKLIPELVNARIKVYFFPQTVNIGLYKGRCELCLTTTTRKSFFPCLCSKPGTITRLLLNWGLSSAWWQYWSQMKNA